VKKITIKDIRDLDPCYDPVRYLPRGWSGTVDDLLYIEGCPIDDVFWVVLRDCFLPENLMHEFACCCAESVLHIFETKHPGDGRPRKVIDAKRKFVLGEIDRQDLDTASGAAIGAARYAARYAAMSAARGAAWSAARDAARCAANDTASGAAWSAARYAAWSAARDAARSAQLEFLRDLVHDWQIAEEYL